MTLVEKEVTQRNVELAEHNPELNKHREREMKLLATRPSCLSGIFRAESVPVEQIYLSTPADEFSLRIRRMEKAAGDEYTATLKDRGKVIKRARDRFELNTPISENAYWRLAANTGFGRLQKLRAEPIPGVTIDFIDDGEVELVEVETNDPKKRALLTSAMTRLNMGNLLDVTGDTQYDNESLAYRGIDYLKNPESLDAFTNRVVQEMVAQYATGKNQVVVGLTGMSGSGKTTVTRGIEESITELFGEQYKPLVVSTDDYHFGKKRLDDTYGEWNAWDDPRTYNTAELAADLALMAEGQSLIRRHFDFETEEVVFDEEVPPSPFVVVEGLYAGSKDLETVRDLHFELPTGIATSVGRDIRRLVIENRANRAFPTPESRLRYQIETALPIYLSKDRPRRNSFSASVRIMAERSFMLERLKASA